MDPVSLDILAGMRAHSLDIRLSTTAYRGRLCAWLCVTRGGEGVRVRVDIRDVGPMEALCDLIHEVGEAMRSPPSKTEKEKLGEYRNARRLHRRLLGVLGPDLYGSIPGAYKPALNPPPTT